MEIPAAPYVAIYGSNSGDWRDGVLARLSGAGVRGFEPSSDGWATIDASNGLLVAGLRGDVSEASRKAAL